MITNLLILLSVAFSLYAWLTQNNLAFSEYALMHGSYHTLLTGLFVHANPVHLVGNMLFLYVFGKGLEDEVGDKRTGNVAYFSHVLGFITGVFFGASWNKKWKESLIFTLLLLAIYMILFNYFRAQLGIL